MKRDDLRALNLEDATVNAIMALHGQTANTMNEQINTLTTEKEQLEAQITQRDTQLEQLKTVDAEDLKAQIDAQKAENDTLKTEHEQAIVEQKRQHKIELLATGIGAQDVEYITAKLQDLTLEGDELVGADEKVAQLKEAHPLLFEAKEEVKKIKPWSQGGVSTTQGATYASAKDIMAIEDRRTRQQAIAENPDLFK